MKIDQLKFYEVIDSRGNPTIACKIFSGKFSSISMVPSGASTGSKEAQEIRDNDKKRFLGKGLKEVIKKTEHQIFDVISQKNLSDQQEIDNGLIQLDGSKNKSNIGANMILATSMAVSKLASQSENMELFQYIHQIAKAYEIDCDYSLPLPMMNILNGGAHANNPLEFQEFMIQPVGPEALGWFPKPIKDMADFRKYKFRTPPGIPGQTYKDIGIASVAMGGGDILPALEAGTIDAAEWCCPKPDLTFGFQKVLKHYYLQGLHQVVVNADFYITGKTYEAMSAHEKKSLEVAANASLAKSLSYRIYENGKALKELTEVHGVKLEDTPSDYFTEYMAAAKKSLETNAAKNAFFAEVWDSMKEFADIAVPFWSGAQMSNAKLGMAHAATLK